jgi:hypothetical protein
VLDVIDHQKAVLGINKTLLTESNLVVPLRIVEVNPLPAISSFVVDRANS